MAESVSLVAVASPGLYTDFAREMFSSATSHFLADRNPHFFTVEGDEGWPDGTMYRHHHLLNRFPDTDYVFLIDADMRFEGPVRTEILGTGITATQHPGYVNTIGPMLPFETRPDSHCFVPEQLRVVYCCGGFVGGPHDDMHVLSSQIALRIDKDVEQGITPVWHDESALNSVLATNPPNIVLPPAYCHPDHDDYYRTVWPKEYARKIVALDKTTNQRGNR
jgi:hypothetical protein